MKPTPSQMRRGPRAALLALVLCSLLVPLAFIFDHAPPSGQSVLGREFWDMLVLVSFIHDMRVSRSRQALCNHYCNGVDLVPTVLSNASFDDLGSESSWQSVPPPSPLRHSMGQVGGRCSRAHMVPPVCICPLLLQPRLYTTLLHSTLSRIQ